MSKTDDWCPAMRGTYRAYMPQWLDGATWRDVQIEHAVVGGVPQPKSCGGINHTIGLFGHAQAVALAWMWAATAAAEGRRIEVRAQPYEVVYDIRARAVEDVTTEAKK